MKIRLIAFNFYNVLWGDFLYSVCGIPLGIHYFSGDNVGYTLKFWNPTVSYKGIHFQISQRWILLSVIKFAYIGILQ